MTFVKYTFVCDPDECDALLEFTARDGFGFPSGYVHMQCPCGRNMQYIEQTTQEEEAPMETTNKFLQDQVNMLQNNLKNHQNCDYWKAENGRVQSQIIDVIDEIYQNEWSDVEDIARNLCQIIDYTPTKEIEFTATISFTGTVTVPAGEEVDLEEILSEAYVDINNGDVVINSHELYDANEC